MRRRVPLPVLLALLMTMAGWGTARAAPPSDETSSNTAPTSASAVPAAPTSPTAGLDETASPTGQESSPASSPTTLPATPGGSTTPSTAVAPQTPAVSIEAASSVGTDVLGADVLGADAPAPAGAPAARAVAVPGIIVTIQPDPLGATDPMVIRGQIRPATSVRVHFDAMVRGTALSGFAATTSSADGSFAASVNVGAPYSGSYQVRAWYDSGQGRVTSSWTTANRTGDPAGWQLSVTQPRSGSAITSFTGAGRLAFRGTAPDTSPTLVPRVLTYIWRHDTDTNNWAKVAHTGQNPFDFSLDPPKHSGNYVYYADAGARLVDQTSPGVRLPYVALKVSITGAALDVYETGQLTVSYNHPNLVQRSIRTVQVYHGGAWRFLYRIGTTDPSITVPFTFAMGHTGSYRVRAFETALDGSIIYSPTAVVTRGTQLNAVIRATTAAEVLYTYRSGCPVGPSSLRTVEMNFLGYDKKVHRGSLIVRKDLAPKVAAAFDRGLRGNFAIRQMSNPDAWRANDVTMMASNNTSAFNCRRVTGNPYRLSPHSYGTSIDVNTFENPYRAPSGRWYPSARYGTWRPTTVPGLLRSNSPLTLGLRGQGYDWYSGWDWQHFQY